MARPALREAPPAFLFFGAFSASEEALDDVRASIGQRFGALHPRGQSPSFPFPETRTYGKTMGRGLRRRFFVLEKRWPQDRLAAAKHEAILMEEEIQARRGPETNLERVVNIDPGLINDCRVILASTKDHAHRVYRGEGIWEEVTLIFREGRFCELPWTYRDLKNPEVHAFFEIFREEFLRARD